MKTKISSAIFVVAATLAWQAAAQTYDTNGVVVQTFAGSGFSGYLDGVGQLTMFNNPEQIVCDSKGNLFVWDGNVRLRKIAPDGTVTTFAGGGNQTTGTGTNVNLTTYGIDEVFTIDRNDTIWFVSDAYLYRITSSAIVTRTNALTSIHHGNGICVDSQGNAYISSAIQDKIYRYSTNGLLSVFAGSGNEGYADGNGIFTAFAAPTFLAADPVDNIYVWDSKNKLGLCTLFPYHNRLGLDFQTWPKKPQAVGQGEQSA